MATSAETALTVRPGTDPARIAMVGSQSKATNGAMIAAQKSGDKTTASGMATKLLNEAELSKSMMTTPELTPTQNIVLNIGLAGGLVFTLSCITILVLLAVAFGYGLVGAALALIITGTIGGAGLLICIGAHSAFDAMRASESKGSELERQVEIELTEIKRNTAENPAETN